MSYADGWAAMNLEMPARIPRSICEPSKAGPAAQEAVAWLRQGAQARSTKQKANGDYIPLEIYQADPSDCAACPLKARCVRGRSGARTVRRQEHQVLIDALCRRFDLWQRLHDEPALDPRTRTGAGFSPVAPRSPSCSLP